MNWDPMRAHMDAVDSSGIPLSATVALGLPQLDAIMAM
jgi:hypothetical protein